MDSFEKSRKQNSCRSIVAICFPLPSLCALVLWGALSGLWMSPLDLPAQPGFFDDMTFSRADSLRGGLRPERTCYDVTFYDLCIDVDVDRRRLKGYVDIHFKAVTDFDRLQIDLYRNMVIDSIVYLGKVLGYEREEDAVFVSFPEVGRGAISWFRVYYHGHPKEAPLAPWQGGFVWTVDAYNRPWVGVAVQGAGASLWWPNKDHLGDEPDSAAIRVAVPKGLTCVSNGQLESIQDEGDRLRFNWRVSYPINNYNITLNIGHYHHLEDKYVAEDGAELNLDYYVMTYNRKRAPAHFEQVHEVLACFEQYFGKYPFWEDGFALVETPYLGMEHQSAIAYGNKYMRGYLGGMIPSDMDWDYVIVHETGHEYFGNSLSTADMAEIWIHESFTTYMEALFVECRMGYDDALRYLGTQRRMLVNAEPMLGPMEVNWDHWSESDHYFKGAWILHTFRHWLDDDEAWFALLREFYEGHQLDLATTEDFKILLEKAMGQKLDAVFEQYFRYPDLPCLEFRLAETEEGLQVSYRWKADVSGFDMPILAGKADEMSWLYPTSQWQETYFPGLDRRDFELAEDRFLLDLCRLR